MVTEENEKADSLEKVADRFQLNLMSNKIPISFLILISKEKNFKLIEYQMDVARSFRLTV